MNDNIILDEKYIDNSTQEYRNAGELFEMIMSDYIGILYRLIATEGIQGQIAIKLGEFVSLVERLVVGEFVMTFEEQTKKMYKYIEEIDEADNSIIF